MPMQSMPMQSMPMQSMPMQSSPQMQVPYPNIVPSQIPQAGNVVPPVGHVSNLIQKFDPNSPIKKPQDDQKQDSSSNPFDLF
jgi:hypothetical protein